VMLYRGAARFVGIAVEGIEAHNIELANEKLGRAQAIVFELIATLDLERGGELASNLLRIYEYMNHRLVEANLRKDAEPAREVQGLLRELLPAWEAAARQTAAAPARQTVGAAA
jgi:flagellar secretion chaperone FliS